MSLTQEEAHRLFEYKDGVLYWKVSSAQCVEIGDTVGGTNGRKNPYLRTQINKQRYLVHRIIFLMWYGYMPEIIDHIDGNISNNKIDNLRPANRCENRHNASKNKNNTSNCKNVFYHKNRNVWMVRVMANKKIIHCGTFKDFELAELVAHEARDLYHGQFARHA
jgi:hypothetical protein